MSVFTALTVIAIVAIVAEMIKSLAKSRGLHSSKQQQNQQLEQKIAQLQERVATLEAIVTDKNYDLSKEIDQL